MQNFIYRPVFALLALALIYVMASVGCNPPQAFPDEPRIEYVSMEPLEIREDNDSGVVVTIHFEDGDGDLGYENLDEDSPKDFIIIDNRDNIPANIPPDANSSNLPYLTPDARNPSIQGTIKMTAPGQRVYGIFAEQEKTTYTIYIRDRAGNVSNEIETDTLTILRAR